MYIKNIKNIDRLIERLRISYKKGEVLTNILKTSDYSSLEEVKKAMPDFVNAMVKYISFAEMEVRKGIIPVQFGLVVESPDERKEVNRAFTIDNSVKRKLFYPNWYLTAHEDFMYRLIEAYFDITLLTEQGAIRKFKEFVKLYNSLIPAVELGDCFFGIYDAAVILINVSSGCIYKLKSTKIKNKIKKYGINSIQYDEISNEYQLILKNKLKYSLTKNGKITSIMSDCRSKKDKTKEYYQVTIIGRDKKNNLPAVQFPAHSLVLLAKYGLNVAKHCLSKDGLLTCDHVDMVGNNNKARNLEIVTRVDNCIRARGKDPIRKEAVCSYDLADYFMHICQCYCMDKKDVAFKINYLNDMWKEKLLIMPAIDYVWCA